MAAKHNLKLPYAEELAAVRIEEVARIAAMLLREGSREAGVKGGAERDRLVAATATAFELLEIAYYGQRGLRNRDSYEAGLDDFVESKKTSEGFLEVVEKIPRWAREYDADGRLLPVPFDKALAKLMPKPGVEAGKIADERMTRFEAFMIDRYRTARPEQDEQERLSEVRDRIAEWKRDGIPADTFDGWVHFPLWWEARQREKKSAAGKKGQEVKQAKQAASEPKQARKKKR